MKIGFDLLGREGFFDRFVICFDDRERILNVIQRDENIKEHYRRLDDFNGLSKDEYKKRLQMKSKNGS